MTRNRKPVDLRLLDSEAPRDIAAVTAVVVADPGYVQRVEGRAPGPGDAEKLLRHAPPGVSSGDKAVLGGFEEERLVAVVDLIRGWPTRGTTLIGLLQVHAKEHGRGLGRAVHEAALEWVAEHWPETCNMRAVIVASNAAQAEPFWRAMGYRPRGAPVPYAGDHLESTAQVWMRALSQPGT